MPEPVSFSFPPANRLAWLAQVQQELRSENACETLRWHTPEGFPLEPYYTVDELAQVPLSTIQAAQKQTPGWLNTPEYVVTDEKATNATLRNALLRGADALALSVTNDVDLARLLNGIRLSDTPVFFRTSETVAASKLVRNLKTVAPYQLKGGLLMPTDNETAEATHLTANSPQFRTIYAGSHDFHNAGATATQELAFVLASLADTYDTLTDAGLTLEQLVPKTILSLSVGTSYFPEIAKLRALRVLLRRFLNAYKPPPQTAGDVLIHGQTSTFYDSTATLYTNLLRSTTEAMAAVIGGCDALTVHPYNAVLEKQSNHDFPERIHAERIHAERIARNVSILLKEESYFDKVADPAAGSYYVETATYQLVEQAWTLFLNVEKQGGFAQSMASGFVQAEIDRAYRAKVEAVRSGKVLVGVTKFRPDDGHAAKQAAPDVANGLPNRRLAGEFE